MNSQEEIDNLRDYFEQSIIVCEERIKIEGENGDNFWLDMKERWITKLKELNEESDKVFVPYPPMPFPKWDEEFLNQIREVEKRNAKR